MWTLEVENKNNNSGSKWALLNLILLFKVLCKDCDSLSDIVIHHSDFIVSAI